MAKWTYKKYMGDDLYSWAVFKDGQPVMTGMGRADAKYTKERYEREEKRKREEQDAADNINQTNALCAAAMTIIGG